jgi:hypothetical protein
MPTDKHGEGNHHILAKVCCQAGKYQQQWGMSRVTKRYVVTTMYNHTVHK